VGDVMIYKKDTTLDRCGQFTAQIQTLDIPGEIKRYQARLPPPRFGVAPG